MTTAADDFARAIFGGGPINLEPSIELEGYNSGAIHFRVDDIGNPNFIEIYIPVPDGYQPLLNRRQIHQLVEWLKAAAIYIDQGPKEVEK